MMVVVVVVAGPDSFSAFRPRRGSFRYESKAAVMNPHDMPPTPPEFGHRGVGGGDIVTLLGLSPFSNRRRLYHLKRGEIAREPMGVAARMGLELEPIIVKRAAEELGESIKTYPCEIVRVPDCPWRVCVPDAELASGDLVSAKATVSRARRFWNNFESVTDSAMYQAQWEMYVCGRERVWVAVLVDGRDLHLFPVERDDDIIEPMIELADGFWRQVVTGDAPEWDVEDAGDLKHVQAVHSTIAEGDAIWFSKESVEAIRRRDEIAQEQRKLSDESDKLKASILAEMGDAELGYIDSSTMLKRYEVEATDSRSGFVTARIVKRPSRKRKTR